MCYVANIELNERGDNWQKMKARDIPVISDIMICDKRICYLPNSFDKLLGFDRFAWYIMPNQNQICGKMNLNRFRMNTFHAESSFFE